MKKSLTNFLESFAFTSRDRNGIIVLTTLILLSIIARIYSPFWDSLQAGLPEIPPTFAIDSNPYKPAQTSDSTTQTDFPQREKKYAPRSEHKLFTLQLNSSDSLDWQELRGIGASYARRIIAYREKLGGFVCKEQLLEVWGIDSALYEKICPSLVVDGQNIVKISLNTVSLDFLKRHPYLDYYQAKEIIKHREKTGAFTKLEDLKKVNLMDGETFAKISAYFCL